MESQDKSTVDEESGAQSSFSQALCDECFNDNPKDFDSGFCFSTDPEHDMSYHTCRRCGNIIGKEDWDNAIARVDAGGNRDNDDLPGEGVAKKGDDEEDEDEAEDELNNPNQHLIRLILHSPCSCGNSDPDKFRSVTDHKGLTISSLKFCLQCENVCGADDTMSEDDCQRFLRDNPVQMEACAGCGTTNPDDYFLEEIDGRIAMRCHACQNTVYSEQPETETCDEDAFKHYVEDVFASCACGNSDRDLFSCEYDGQGYPHKGQCLVCFVWTVLGGRKQLTCYCQNFDPMQFLYISDQENKLITIRCLYCLQDFQPGKWLKHSDLGVKGKSDVCAKTRITRLDELQPGDHVSWHRNWGYWHHALVTEVGRSRHRLKVIEYTGPIKDKIFMINGEIAEHWIDVDARKDEFYRFDYSPGDCRPPEEAIRRARLRLGEKDYSLIWNNCEHFVRSVKLNKEVSLQVKTVIKEAVRLGTKALCAAPKLLGKSGLGAGVFLAVEVGSLLHDIQDALEQRKKGLISRNTFVKIVLKRTGQTGGGLAGFVLGTLLLPEFLFGTVAVGMCVGLGSFIGMLLGKQAGDYLVK